MFWVIHDNSKLQNSDPLCVVREERGVGNLVEKQANK